MLWHLLVGWDFLHKCFLPNTTERCSSISASARNAFPLRRFTAGKQRCYSELLYIGSASTRATRLQPADPSNDAHSSVGHSNTNGQSRVHASRGADWEKRRFSAVLALLPHNACDETTSLTSLFALANKTSGRSLRRTQSLTVDFLAAQARRIAIAFSTLPLKLAECSSSIRPRNESFRALAHLVYCHSTCERENQILGKTWI